MRSARQVVEDVRLEAVRGRVMDAQVWSETHVRGSGSGVMVRGFGVGSSKTTSTVVNRREVCIEAEDGLQIVEAFGANQVTLMPGQEVTLIRAPRRSEIITVAVRNHSMRKSMITGKEQFEGISLLLLASPFVTIAAIFTIAMGMNADNSTVALWAFVPLFGNFYWFRAAAIRDAFRKRVELMMNESEKDLAQRRNGSAAA